MPYYLRDIGYQFAPFSTISSGGENATIGQWNQYAGYMTEASIAAGATAILYTFDTGGTKDVSIEATIQILAGTEIETVKVLAHIINTTVNYTTYGIIYSGASSRWDIQADYDAGTTSLRLLVENTTAGSIASPQANYQIIQVEAVA
jgi:hypothetical protein